MTIQPKRRRRWRSAWRPDVICPGARPFGPTNGPEDFQDLAFNAFNRRLYRERCLFFDDLSVATGRKIALRDGPSGAGDAWGKLRPKYDVGYGVTDRNKTVTCI